RLDSGEELGASIGIDIGGETGADMWGGPRGEGRTVPWARDTLTNVWASTKTVTKPPAPVLAGPRPACIFAPVSRYQPGIRGQRQAGHRGQAPALAHVGRLGLGTAVRRPGHVRLGEVNLAARWTGTLVGTGHRIRVPRAEPRTHGGRAGPQDYRQAAQAVRGR